MIKMKTVGRISFWILLWIIGISGCTQDKKQPANDDPYTWTKLSDTSAWPGSYNFEMLSIEDTLWIFHQEGNWFSLNGLEWIKSTLPNVVGNLAFVDYIPFKNKIFGIGHVEGNSETHTYLPTIYFSTDHMHWDSVENTNMQKRYFTHPFVFLDKLWMIGGEDDATLYADIVQSEDGIHWQIMKDMLPFGPVINSQFVVFQNKIWMFNNDVWNSADGMNWTQVSKAIVPGVDVFGYKAVVYDDAIWLIGCNRNEQFTSQVLNSTDGVNWKSQNAPWTPRGGVAACVFKNQIFMTGGKFGGTQANPEFVYSNDLWKLAKR